jgi:hypothetical protein
MPRLLYPWERDSVPNAQEAEWAPGPAWKGAENLVPTRIQFPGSLQKKELQFYLFCYLDVILVFSF